ncbi:hypothetical protein [Mesorhizobium shangrilense]|uniref:Uncharacterized protein n=1 Tax=Mesorhizobium shangrilense TaxID=460060 RepID=A0ABV2D772_9HYPH
MAGVAAPATRTVWVAKITTMTEGAIAATAVDEAEIHGTLTAGCLAGGCFVSKAGAGAGFEAQRGLFACHGSHAGASRLGGESNILSEPRFSIWFGRQIKSGINHSHLCDCPLYGNALIADGFLLMVGEVKLSSEINRKDRP